MQSLSFHCNVKVVIIMNTRANNKQSKLFICHTLHQPECTNCLRDKRNNTTQIDFEGELDVKLHAEDVKFGTSMNGNSRQDGFTVLDLLKTKAIVLLGFSIMHQ